MDVLEVMYHEKEAKHILFASLTISSLTRDHCQAVYSSYASANQNLIGRRSIW
jgi:hypothetical protein